MEPRRFCYRCHRPECACICELLTPSNNRVGLLILQHPRERFHPLGTARIARLGLTNVRVETLWPSAPPERPAELPPRTGLLYPGSKARVLSDVPVDERPEHLVVLDGTWHHARTMYRDTPWLHELPQYALRPRAPSRYRIRKEPRAECLSTIESIARALELCEANRGAKYENLVEAFDAMIDRQIDALRRRTKTPRHKPTSGRRSLPRAFHDAASHLVVVYGESSLTEARRHGRERRLIQWTAVRLATKTVFDAIVRADDRSLLRPWHLGHMDLSPEELSSGELLPEFRRAWKAFTREDDILVAWNHGVIELLRSTVGYSGPSILLKCTYASHSGSGGGSLESIVANEGLTTDSLPLRGRARQRLGNALALTMHLCRAASDRRVGTAA